MDPSVVTFSTHPSQNPCEGLHQDNGQNAGLGPLFPVDSMMSAGLPSPDSFVHQINTTLQDNVWDVGLLPLMDPLPPMRSVATDLVCQPSGGLTHSDRLGRLEYDHCVDLYWPTSEQIPMENYISIGRFENPPSSSRSQQPSQRSSPLRTSASPQGSMSDSPIPPQSGSIGNGVWLNGGFDAGRRSTPNGAHNDHVAPASINSESSNGDTEDSLFMHYLDDVFYAQYPFYHLENRQGRGWVLAILRRTKSAYHAALGLSELHLLLTPLNREGVANNLIQLRKPSGYFGKAVQKLQTMIFESHAFTGPAAVKPSLEILMTLLQLFFFEVSLTGRADRLPSTNFCSNHRSLHLSRSAWLQNLPAQ
jgi:hypothetical protein